MSLKINYSDSVAGKQQRLKKGDKVLTAAGNIETVIRYNANDNIETEENQYSWATDNLKKIES